MHTIFFLSACIIMVLNTASFFLKKKEVVFNIKLYALYFSIFIFLCTTLLWIIYDPFQVSFQQLFKLKIFSFHFYIGIDGLSLFFIYLTSFLIPCCILFNYKNIYQSQNEYLITLLSLEILLIIIFCVMDLLLFYIFFESILIPLFIFIGIWGSRERKIHASYLLFLYTLLGSLFMLFAIITLYSHSGTTDLQILWNTEFSLLRERLLWLAFFFAFAVKVPMFPFHIWLPEAHVEAPTEGSVLLAGVILKLGTYGFLRLLIPIFFNATIYFLPLILLLCCVAVIYTSFTTLRQIDLKRIIAYSSVAHMNIAVLGLFSLDSLALNGSILLLISHGIVSGGLFFMIGMIYDRFKTRIIKYYSGLVQLMPLYTAILFLLILGNMSIPGTSSFVGEFLIFCGIINKSTWSLLILSIGTILGALYSIWFYNRIAFGILNIKQIQTIVDLTRLEVCLLLPFVFYMLFIGIYPKPFIDNFAPNLIYLITQF